jgi:2-C-methyl-D-erythritol 2,4-cyclodiphosphate synthase
MMRIGQGFDVHGFTKGRPLILGGVTIPHEYGLAAHSDGDAVLHAICDALLGSLSLGDIGQHFADNDPKNKNLDSRIMLRHIVEMIHHHQYEIVNIDCTIIAQQPKLADYYAAMQANIAEDTLVTINQVSVKATTTEKMGFTGRKEGIACMAIALVKPIHLTNK